MKILNENPIDLTKTLGFNPVWIVVVVVAFAVIGVIPLIFNVETKRHKPKQTNPYYPATRAEYRYYSKQYRQQAMDSRKHNRRFK